MANLDFSMTENGYSPEEVDRYVEMIQQEYSNAVAWGEEMEAKYDQLKEHMERGGIFFTIDENNQNEVIDKVFEELKQTVTKVKNEAEQKAREVIDKANEKSRHIVKQAMESSVEIRTQNDRIIKNLKSIDELINVIIEKSTEV